jgi:hypothetical protein
MTSKEARKTSMDPAQEKLRQTKAAWNKEVSSFLNDVIHFKKLMNGWPSKYFKERSKITLPIPADPASIVNSLASHFQDLAQQGAAISQQQAQYSQTRRQKRTDQATQTLNKLDEKYGPTGPEVASPIAATPAPTGSELTKQLGAAWEHKYELVSEGSNPFSRLLTKMRTPRVGVGAGAQKRRMRMDLLKAALKSYRALGRFQVQISKSSKDSVISAYKDQQQAWNEWSTVSRYFNQYVNSIPGQTPRPEEMKDELAPGAEQELPNSLIKYKFRAEAPIDVTRFLQMAKISGVQISNLKIEPQTITNEGAKVPIPDVEVVFQSNSTLEALKKILAQVPDGHVMYETIAEFSSYTGERTGGKAQTPLRPVLLQKEIKKQPSTKKQEVVVEPTPTVSPQVNSASDQLEVVAQAFLQKWLGKKRHQLLPGKSSGLRLQLFELATKTRTNINAVMDLLEKGLSIEDLGSKISEVSGQMNTIRSLTRSLHNMEKPMKGQPTLEGFF